ncbi:glycosyltransferase [Microbacterium ulmi]|uniref:Glycosyltransferase n=1 Tax=Microbacterium ulmi TaxID=179095 RepID=A0A7Y2LZP2_9MICO|nr:glycosyltransferase involved in cell wall biosynthesis [Microbacterium ulmi]NNH03274.1 glycosyltransferase [Microbacterium ulmi]
MPPRILVIDHTSQEGGGQLALLRVVEQLNGDRADIRALVFSSGVFVDRLRAAGIETAVLELDPAVNQTSRDRVLAPAALVRSLGRSVAFVPRLARAIRGARADVVVANTLKAAVFTALAAPLAGRRWVWHVHDRIAPDYLPAPLVAALRVLAVLGPRAIVVNSEATLATLPGRARRKSTLAYPGLAADAFDSPSDGADRAVVGLIGRISPTKGQRQFLEAAASVAETNPSTRFRVVGAALFGEDAYESSVRALPEALGIADRVEFTGWVPDAGRHLRELGVVVHASPVPEPFGQVVVEAMAAGVPVVATAAGGVPEILDPDGTADLAGGWAATEVGVLVRPGDSAALAAAIRAILDEPEARAARAVAARAAAAERFTIERTADAVWRAWRGAASGTVGSMS